jgi:hypothetical protein
MRWLTDIVRTRWESEHGAVAILLAISLVVLIGATAFTVDFGTMHLQRRQHQNSADAGALAIAQDCARGTCPADENARAEQYTAANESQNSDPGNFGPSTSVAEYPAAGTVRVTVAGDNEPIFRQVLQQDARPIEASATAIWGRPSTLQSVIPVMFSICEYEYYAQPDASGTPTNLAPQPPYTPNPPYSYPDPSLEVGMLLRTPIWETTGIDCARGPAGQIAAGSFSWLETSSGCVATTSVGNWWRGGTGNAPGDASCKSKFDEYRGSVVYLPIYSGAALNSDGSGECGFGSGQPNCRWYLIENYVAFYLTGYRMPSVGSANSIATGRSCGAIAPPTGPGGGVGADPCLSGFFTSGIIPASELPPGAIVPGDISGSVVAVQLTD